MFSIKDLLQLTRLQKIVITSLLSFAPLSLTAYLVYLFIHDPNGQFAAAIFPAVQYLWIVLSVWAGVLLIGQGDSPGRIASLTDEFLEKIFPQSVGVFRFLNTREHETEAAITDALFSSGDKNQMSSTEWNFQVSHHKGSPFAFYKFSIIKDGRLSRSASRMFLHINNHQVTVVLYYWLDESAAMEDLNASMLRLLESFLESEKAFGYEGSVGKSIKNGVNLFTLSLTTKLAENFLNSGRLKLAFSHDIAMMIHALLMQIESNPKLNNELIETMNDIKSISAAS